jgi:glycine/serine hydroxymethyltransferase
VSSWCVAVCPLGRESAPTGSPAMTSRGFSEEDFAKVAEFIDRAVKISLVRGRAHIQTTIRASMHHVMEHVHVLI